ncbi:hypothetical protein LTS08_002666 [Lithohypha guttulata]|nr:hypothetical protein LTS08_002666 [Lithohypha guttulata]
MDDKLQSTTITNHGLNDTELASADVVVVEKVGTSRDAEHMRRLGRKQELRPHCVVAFGLFNGGTAGLIYTYLIVVFLFFLTNVSMAEMASMAPTAGGQYHWISEFAPRRAQKVLSYFIGWLCTLGWQSGVAIGCFLAGTQIQGLIILNDDSYVYARWHGTLLTMAMALFVFVFNTFLARHLPLIEGLVLCLHLGGFVAILVPLWVLGPRGNSHEIWTKFDNLGGWDSTGLSVLVGLITPLTSLLGADAAVHMAEELKDAGRILPRAMIWTSAINGVLGFTMLVTFCYTLGDLEEIVATPTGFPFIQVFYNATGSKGGATAMTLILTVSSTANAMTNMATASRQLWAFARDGGVPFHRWFATVQPRFEIPLNAVVFTAMFTILFSLVNIGSTVAFNQILSLGLGALLISYFISIFCVTLRRIRGQPLLPSSFQLGKLGLPINILSLCFLAVGWVMSFFPAMAHPTPQSMNWSSLTFSSVMILGAIYYVLKARHHYVGPVEYVQKTV